jgi:guanylate kinase
MKSKLALFCGPSGSGKTTIVKHLLDKFPQLSFSISATTRTKRANEIDGKDYYFMSVDEFKKNIVDHAFLEWEEVYENGFYGTLNSEINRIGTLGKAAIFDVDVEGGLKIKGKFGKNLLAVFVVPPSVEELKLRLEARESETPESLKKRVEKAEHEITYRDKFSHVIVNKDLDESLLKAEELITEFLNT